MRIRLSVYLNFPRMCSGRGWRWLVFMAIIRARGIPLSRVIRRFAIFAYRHLSSSAQKPQIRFWLQPRSQLRPLKGCVQSILLLPLRNWIRISGTYIHLSRYPDTHKPPAPARTVYGNSYLTDIKVSIHI